MATQYSIRLTLLTGMLLVPIITGCSQDNHGSATGGVTQTGLTPDEPGPGGSGSIYSYKVNAGGPGSPGDPAPAPTPAPAEKPAH